MFGGFFWLSQTKNSPLKLQTTPTPSVTEKITVQPTIDNNDLKQGGSSYTDPNNVYVFLYPSDYKLDTQNDGRYTRIYKTGPTQKGQTEIYDGVLLVFETITLNGATLQEWVDNSILSATKDGTSTVTVPAKGVTISSYSGFTYSMHGLGETKYYVLQKDSRSTNAVLIATLVSDPQNVGFQKDVDKILSTLEILK